MATYKVIQDIEADDKLLGPLTLRQFIYAGVTALCVWFCYVVVAKGAPFLVPIFIVPGIVSAFFAFPWSKEQPTEIWALARIRFLFKSRQRIWSQDGLKELVTITVPKKIEHVYSDGLSQTEVRSRLNALASTIDTRGWAIKNTVANPYASSVFAANANDTQRLINPSALPNDIPASTEIYEDVLDPATNPKAEQFDHMLATQAQNHRQQLIDTMQGATTPEPPRPTTSSASQPAAPDYWFLNQPPTTNVPAGNSMFGQQVVPPGSQPDDITQVGAGMSEELMVEQLRRNQTSSDNMNSHLPTILPLAEQQRLAEERARQQAALYQEQKAQAVTPQPDAAILDLARNDDLNIATIAREAQKAHSGDLRDEVVVSLH